MAHEMVQMIIGTAIVDARFRQNLLKNTVEVLRDFELTPEESEALARIQADTLHGFAQEVQLWLNTQTIPRVPTPTY
ncbi:MAG: hypothetical protein H5T69_19640 [Chloroflexi bacterium]|nr:hypothetical protein [Chloroflexota bacterium]